MARWHAILALLLACSALVSPHNASEPLGDGAAGKTRVAVMVPCSPRMNAQLKRIMMQNLRRLPNANPALHIEIFVDAGPLGRQPGDERPLSKTARLRNRMVDAVNASRFDYFLWIDADVVEYPPDLPSRLILSNPGVTAPLVLIEEPGPHGPNQFYDTTAFTLKGKGLVDPGNRQPYVVGRSLNMFPPYIPDHLRESLNGDPNLVKVDGVGTVYSIPTAVFTTGGARYEDHLSLTEHWSVVSRAHALGMPVALNTAVTVRHANLPNYGEAWHANHDP